MKTPFENWDDTHNMYDSDLTYAEAAFNGGIQYALTLTNDSMPPEISKAIGEAVRENIGVDIE